MTKLIRRILLLLGLLSPVAAPLPMPDGATPVEPPGDEVLGLVVEAPDVERPVGERLVGERLVGERPGVESVSAVDRGTAAVDGLPITPHDVGFTIAFAPPRADAIGGLMWPDRRHIDIFVDPSWSDAELQHVVAHEIGHAVDLVANSGADRLRWLELRDIDRSVPWWAAPYQPDFATPSGDFAECFAEWATATRLARSGFGSCSGTGALIGELVADLG